MSRLRANMEKKIGLIANGKYPHQKVLAEELELFKRKFDEFVQKVFFVSHFSPVSSSGKPFSKCGKCRRYMHLIHLK